MMVLCSKCKRRPAVVFIQTMHGNEKKSEGLCMPCARQMNIPQVKEYMEQMGITDEELEQMSDQMMELMDGDHFEMGGSGTLPPFIQNLLGGNAAQKPEEAGNPRPESNQDHSRSKKKKEKTRELKFLDNYCTNLSKQAEEGKLDNIVGREREIARVIQILSRRQKNNPCLIGEPGVGKTAIAEGIAQKIAAGEVPFNLRGKRVYLMDLTSLVAGTQFRGQFESRVKGLISEVKEQGNIILFIDEVHNLIGTGDSEGSMNAANILKPALSRGEIQVIGATTFSEYRKYIEKDSALERRFQPVTVNVPSIDDTVAVLMGIKKYYEAFHRVKISEYLVRMCAVLSDRYINDRFLPDKAIDLLDESCACASIRHPELGQLDETRKSIAEKETQEKEIEESESPDYQALAEVKADLIRLREQLEQLEKQTANITVSEADLAQVVEVWTGVPASKITQTEFTKLEHLEESLSKRVIGQSEAISVLSRAIKRTRVQLSKRRRPASFIFVGPTGVGKTELVKVLAEEMFDSAEALIRLDMTEYMEKHAVAKMIGSPPGYVGYDEAGQLTEKVRRRPYSVVLFDEIEKAHPDIMNLLLQILDEGRLNDAHGRSISFENTIIVMTSNAGSTDKSTGMGFNKTEGEISREKALKALRDFLRPEFIGRVDEVVVFRPLTVTDFADIAGLMLSEMAQALEEKEVKLDVTRAALEEIAKEAFGKPYGARDLRRVIRQKVEDPVAELLLRHSGYVEKLSVDVLDGALHVSEVVEVKTN
ncbi:ATP-dependent Clp protease ATP-binding subunit [Ruminococcus sp.]|uniref:ATP-dependent Clp protease ATP-binding subunit n=1 Tax=Ruminococcus sp. TaxID=41978 RepID=UPI0025FC692D|nr:ATP-dependent Clp protease ATP-binding subunit [Ruminococcus sp.]MCI5815985.1 ATP-dependent Clp protease ATP-binding subunit [Ruminococcus sp.]MDD7555840.1 ATP-dependent Clp protease ATP-binding subunit [Ruminococcus sp.]